jgi:hypothetical protein
MVILNAIQGNINKRPAAGEQASVLVVARIPEEYDQQCKHWTIIGC